MTRDRVRSAQTQPEDGLRLITGCTIAAVSPLRVKFPAGTVLPAVAIPGAIYTVGNPAVALFQPPAAPVLIPTS